MNIYEKLSKITAEITAVAKNLTVATGKGKSYKAVSEGDVLRAVKPLEEKYKVYSYPCKRSILDTNIFTKTKTYDGETTESTQLFMRVQTTYRFVNIEKPDEFIDIDTYGDGVDAQDKAPGKAMTYSDKYALLKAYKIETGDDPDQWGSDDLGKGTKTKSDKPPKQDLSQMKPTDEQLADLKKIKRTLTHVATANGVEEKAVTAQHVADYLVKALAFQQEKEARKQAEAEKEANEIFPSGGEDE